MFDLILFAAYLLTVGLLLIGAVLHSTTVSVLALISSTIVAAVAVASLHFWPKSR